MITRDMAEELIQTFATMHKKGPTKDVQEITRGEMPLLAYMLLENPNPTPTEISAKFELSTARIANTLNSLEKKGFIERVHDKTDRRKVYVHITEAGRNITKSKYEEGLRHMMSLMEALGEEDSIHMIRIAKKVKQFMEHHHAHEQKPE